MALAWTATAANSVLVRWSDVGLHETDGTDFSVYALMPSYSTIYGKTVAPDEELAVTWDQQFFRSRRVP